MPNTKSAQQSQDSDMFVKERSKSCAEILGQSECMFAGMPLLLAETGILASDKTLENSRKHTPMCFNHTCKG